MTVIHLLLLALSLTALWQGRNLVLRLKWSQERLLRGPIVVKARGVLSAEGQCPRGWRVLDLTIRAPRYEDAVLTAFKTRWNVMKWGARFIYVKDGGLLLYVGESARDPNAVRVPLCVAPK